MKTINVRPQTLIGGLIIGALPFVGALWIGFGQGKFGDAAWIGISSLVVVTVVYLLCRLRIIVTDDAIIVRQPFESEERANFEDIVVSRLTPNRHRPKHLHIFTRQPRNDDRGDVFIPLEAFRSKDRDWLLSLEALKLE